MSGGVPDTVDGGSGKVGSREAAQPRGGQRSSSVTPPCPTPRAENVGRAAGRQGAGCVGGSARPCQTTSDHLSVCCSHRAESVLTRESNHFRAGFHCSAGVSCFLGAAGVEPTNTQMDGPADPKGAELPEEMSRLPVFPEDSFCVLTGYGTSHPDHCTPQPSQR